MPVSQSSIDACQFLHQLPDSTQKRLLMEANSLRVKNGTQLFDDGDASESLALVVSGSVRVFKRSPGGREVSLYRVNQNNLCIVTLGCLMGGDTYPATAYTEEDTLLITIPRQLFLNLIATDDTFRTNTFHQFANRVSGLMQLIDEITFNKLDQRLTDYLLSSGPVIYKSHQDIADELGSVREMISRLLKQFENNEWIKLSRGYIEILEKDKLQDYSVLG